MRAFLKPSANQIVSGGVLRDYVGYLRTIRGTTTTALDWVMAGVSLALVALAVHLGFAAPCAPSDTVSCDGGLNNLSEALSPGGGGLAFVVIGLHVISVSALAGAMMIGSRAVDGLERLLTIALEDGDDGADDTPFGPDVRGPFANLDLANTLSTLAYTLFFFAAVAWCIVIAATG